LCISPRWPECVSSAAPRPGDTEFPPHSMRYARERQQASNSAEAGFCPSLTQLSKRLKTETTDMDTTVSCVGPVLIGEGFSFHTPPVTRKAHFVGGPQSPTQTASTTFEFSPGSTPSLEVSPASQASPHSPDLTCQLPRPSTRQTNMGSSRRDAIPRPEVSLYIPSSCISCADKRSVHPDALMEPSTSAPRKREATEDALPTSKVLKNRQGFQPFTRQFNLFSPMQISSSRSALAKP
jgi:hypothetical protein